MPNPSGISGHPYGRIRRQPPTRTASLIPDPSSPTIPSDPAYSVSKESGIPTPKRVKRGDWRGRGEYRRR